MKTCARILSTAVAVALAGSACKPAGSSRLASVEDGDEGLGIYADFAAFDDDVMQSALDELAIGSDSEAHGSYSGRAFCPDASAGAGEDEGEHARSYGSYAAAEGEVLEMGFYDVEPAGAARSSGVCASGAGSDVEVPFEDDAGGLFLGHTLNRPWPEATVIYDWSDEFAKAEYKKKPVLTAFFYLRKFGFKFLKKRSDRTSGYLKIFDQYSCRANVGHPGESYTSRMEVGGCGGPGSIVHELMHVLGFHHEQQRTDRDRYVIVNVDGDEVNFGKASGTPRGAYDYLSIMHYGLSTRMKINPDAVKGTTEREELGRRMGQRMKITETDLGALRALYGSAVVALDPIPRIPRVPD